MADTQALWSGAPSVCLADPVEDAANKASAERFSPLFAERETALLGEAMERLQIAVQDQIEDPLSPALRSAAIEAMLSLDHWLRVRRSTSIIPGRIRRLRDSSEDRLQVASDELVMCMGENDLRCAVVDNDINRLLDRIDETGSTLRTLCEGGLRAARLFEHQHANLLLPSQGLDDPKQTAERIAAFIARLLRIQRIAGESMRCAASLRRALPLIRQHRAVVLCSARNAAEVLSGMLAGQMPTLDGRQCREALSSISAALGRGTRIARVSRAQVDKTLDAIHAVVAEQTGEDAQKFSLPSFFTRPWSVDREVALA